MRFPPASIARKLGKRYGTICAFPPSAQDIQRIFENLHQRSPDGRTLVRVFREYFGMSCRYKVLAFLARRDDGTKLPAMRNVHMIMKTGKRHVRYRAPLHHLTAVAVAVACRQSLVVTVEFFRFMFVSCRFLNFRVFYLSIPVHSRG